MSNGYRSFQSSRFYVTSKIFIWVSCRKSECSCYLYEHQLFPWIALNIQCQLCLGKSNLWKKEHFCLRVWETNLFFQGFELPILSFASWEIRAHPWGSGSWVSLLCHLLVRFSLLCGRVWEPLWHCKTFFCPFLFTSVVSSSSHHIAHSLQTYSYFIKHHNSTLRHWICISE